MYLGRNMYDWTRDDGKPDKTQARRERDRREANVSKMTFFGCRQTSSCNEDTEGADG